MNKTFRALLVAVVLVQILVAIMNEGLARAIAELTAFMVVVALIFDHKGRKKATLESRNPS